jgi:hypothetical protein
LEPTTGRLALLVSLLAIGCGPGGSGATGDVQFFLEAEDTITEGLVPGTEEENVVDGWTVSYSQFLVAIGDVELGRSADASATQRDPDVLVIDLATLPASGTELTRFDDLAAVRWDRLGYSTPAATADAIRDPSVSAADFDAMVAGGCSYLISGTVSSPTGQSCPPGGACAPATQIEFSFCIPAPIAFESCQSSDGMPGISVTAGGTTSGAFTIHGDHLWFNAFPTGGEGTIERRAQWIADADTNQDGTVTQAELEAIDAAQLFTSARHYSLAGAPAGIIVDTAWDFVIAQATTQGHFQGEGECTF